MNWYDEQEQYGWIKVEPGIQLYNQRPGELDDIKDLSLDQLETIIISKIEHQVELEKIMKS
ncbi:hypothetical protein HN865_04575 [Candidatus Woesearchaeota archaeon]|jgi:hypothetical protein|nr:hypothetical protein [Candidatus Woesearchaeota archaeon]MBT7238101.1 hypothetical protein [Candidatus Woesearchaeota archaeon]